VKKGRYKGKFEEQEQWTGSRPVLRPYKMKSTAKSGCATQDQDKDKFEGRALCAQPRTTEAHPMGEAEVN